MAGVTAAEVFILPQVASTLLVTGATGLTAVLIASDVEGTVFVGPSGVTPATGVPLPKGCPLSVSVPGGVLHGVVAEGVSRGVAVRVLTTSP